MDRRTPPPTPRTRARALRRTSLGAALAVLLLLGACRGGGDDRERATPAPTRTPTAAPATPAPTPTPRPTPAATPTPARAAPAGASADVIAIARDLDAYAGRVERATEILRTVRDAQTAEAAATQLEALGRDIDRDIAAISERIARLSTIDAIALAQTEGAARLLRAGAAFSQEYTRLAANPVAARAIAAIPPSVLQFSLGAR